MKRIGYVACVLVLALTSGCLKNFEPALAGAGQLIELGDGKVLGIQIPDSVKAQGRDAARSYVVTKYPMAAPFADAVLDRVFPRTVQAAVGLPQYVSIPVVWSTNVTAKLREGFEVNGSRFISGDQLEAIFVSVKPSAVLTLPAEINSQYTPGEFAAKALGGSTAPSLPVPAGTNVVVSTNVVVTLPSNPTADPVDPTDDAQQDALDGLNDNPQLPPE